MGNYFCAMRDFKNKYGPWALVAGASEGLGFLWGAYSQFDWLYEIRWYSLAGAFTGFWGLSQHINYIGENTHKKCVIGSFRLFINPLEEEF